MTIVIDEWIRQSCNLKKQCELIRGMQIADRTWYEWERLAGAVWNQGQKVSDRVYTDKQAQSLLCIAYLRKHYPKLKLDSTKVQKYWEENKDKIGQVYDAVCAEDYKVPKEEDKKKLVSLSEVKRCCDRVINRVLSRECWSKWKQYLGIAKFAKTVEDGLTSMLVFMACWRRDNPTRKFPRVEQLLVMMRSYSRRAMELETASSSKEQYQWSMRGCSGKDLIRYLAAQGYKVALSTLYKWGGFSQRKHYSISELREWRNKANAKNFRFG